MVVDRDGWQERDKDIYAASMLDDHDDDCNCYCFYTSNITSFNVDVSV